MFLVKVESMLPQVRFVLCFLGSSRRYRFPAVDLFSRVMDIVGLNLVNYSWLGQEGPIRDCGRCFPWIHRGSRGEMPVCCRRLFCFSTSQCVKRLRVRNYSKCSLERAEILGHRNRLMAVSNGLNMRAVKKYCC